MLKVGPAKKVTIYVGEDHQYHGHSLYSAILDFLFYRGVSGANVLRGMAGFGADHHLHSTRILRLAENLPIKIEFIESAEKVEEVLPKLYEMVGTGLIEIQDTTVAKPADATQKDAPQLEQPALKREVKAKLMRIYVGENDKWHDKPLYRAIVESLRANDIAGVTVYQGILGYGANRRIHQRSAFSLSHDRPMMLSVIDTEENLRKILPCSMRWSSRGWSFFPMWTLSNTRATTPRKSARKRHADETRGNSQTVAHSFRRRRQMGR